MWYYVGLVAIAALGGLFWAYRRDIFKRGASEEKLKSMNDMLEDNARVKVARNNLDASPNGSTAGKLRKKYTRK